MNKLLSAALATLALLVSSIVVADDEMSAQYRELATPVLNANSDKIEVVELFWYGCGHCYQFEPYINEWSKTLADDVNLVRLPALFGRLWDVHGQLFFTLEALKAPHSVHQAIFDAIHQQNKNLATPNEMADFLAPLGIDKEAFLKAYDSFGVKIQMEKTKKQLRAYQVTGVPTLIVGGKYVFGVGRAGGNKPALALADKLIEKERSRNAKATE